MITLEIGKTYTTQELQQALGITSRSTWSHKKNEYLDSLSRAYEYEVSYKGKSAFYTFTKQIGEYQKPENKRSREKTDAVIHQFIRDVVEEDNLQTAANIGRRAFESFGDSKTKVAELGLKESTTQEYIRIRMREMFGTKIGQGGTDGYMMEKVWCRLNAEGNYYEEISDKIIKDYYEIVQTIKNEIKKEDVCMFEDYKNGLISREEYGELLINYNTNLFAEAKKKFFNKYGYYPVKVPRYQLSAWNEKEKEYNKDIL